MDAHYEAAQKQFDSPLLYPDPKRPIQVHPALPHLQIHLSGPQTLLELPLPYR